MTFHPEPALQTPSALAMRAYLDTYLNADTSALRRLLADAAVFEFPFASGTIPPILRGSAEIVRYYKALPGKTKVRACRGVDIHDTLDPDFAVAEFTTEATVLATRRSYRSRHVAKLRCEWGKIVHYTEYWDSLLIREASGAPDNGPVPDAWTYRFRSADPEQSDAGREDETGT
ncbi:MAG: nuclear transport factor 2 family protein [Pseudomonadota bacterium]